MIRESSVVAYTGHETDGLVVGDRGRVVLSNDNVIHVLWTTGSKARQITPHYESSLVVITGSHGDGLDDSLDVGGLVTFSARNSYEAGGAMQVVSELSDQGHFASLSDVADEAIALVSARIRQDPSFRVIAAELDEEEAEEVIRYASACVIRDAFGESDE